jgi:putative flippase GtrA
MTLKDHSAVKSERGFIASILLAKTDKTLIQLFRYTFVGGIAYCVDFGSLFFLTEFVKINYLISAAIAFLLGLITNYLLSTLWVFSKRTMANKKMEFLVFSIIGLVGLGLNEALIWFFTELAGFHYLISKMFSTVVVFIWNFFARKKMLFS